MTDEYFYKAQKKIITDDGDDIVSQHAISVAEEIYNEAQALKPADKRLHNNFETALSALIEHHEADALTSLAAVMRHYNIKIDSSGCGPIRGGAEVAQHLFIWEGDEILEHKSGKENDIVEITADDIKTEK